MTTRRELTKQIGGIAAASTAFLAGCGDVLGSGVSIESTDLAHRDGQIGVLVELRDNRNDEAGPVTIEAELVDGDGETIATESIEESLAGVDEGSVIVWFEELGDEERNRVEGAKAEVVD